MIVSGFPKYDFITSDSKSDSGVSTFLQTYRIHDLWHLKKNNITKMFYFAESWWFFFQLFHTFQSLLLPSVTILKKFQPNSAKIVGLISGLSINRFAIKPNILISIISVTSNWFFNQFLKFDRTLRSWLKCRKHQDWIFRIGFEVDSGLIRKSTLDRFNEFFLVSWIYVNRIDRLRQKIRLSIKNEGSI